MIYPTRFTHLSHLATVLGVALSLGMPIPGNAQSAASEAPDLDLTIQYYSRVLTREGVLRESRYEEKMLRRPGHVWVARSLPDQKTASTEHKDHKHFNPAVLPRHVTFSGGKLRVEYVDPADRELVYIAPSEYENVSFDGSWANAYYLIDPQGVALLPLSSRASSVSGARWREREKDGMFQRVLWNDRKMIPLIVETGDKAGTFFQRIEVRQLAGLASNLPWQNLKGYAQKEYSDFLD